MLVVVEVCQILELSRGRRFQALAAAENWIFLSDIFPDSVRRIKIDRFRTSRTYAHWRFEVN